VEGINRKNQGQPHAWNFFEDIKKIQDRCFRFEARRIGREGNEVAHRLASLARLAGYGQSWMGHVPPELVQLVESEYIKLLFLINETSFLRKKKVANLVIKKTLRHAQK
jgi:hypothetical protein